VRSDALGFFWEDMPVVKVAKAPPEKKKPPVRTWEAPDYLPGLEEALAFNVPLLTVEELVTASADEELIFDVEVYPNYFLASFASLRTGKVICFEQSPWATVDTKLFTWVLENLCTVGFHSKTYDLTIAALAAAGHSCEVLKFASDEIIIGNERPYDILRRFKTKALKTNHIDLIEVAPLQGSLKIYNGRLHGRRMQDLPFSPGTTLTYEQAAIVKLYNVNDLTATAWLRIGLTPQIDLRYEMSNEYKVDLRSKSDAQIAEAVISEEMYRITGKRPKPPEIEVGTVFNYQLPKFIRYETDLMRWALQKVLCADFIVGDYGRIIMPPELAEMKIRIADNDFQMGIGGLHSTEKRRVTVSDHTCTIRDRDVTSYYPRVILNQFLYPAHLGPDFLRVYAGIVNRRITAKRHSQDAKKDKDSVREALFKNQAESLKIVINGSFGKFGNMYSVLYAPQLLIQTTITGQLSLLMMIERMELAGITVISANTDGVTMKVPKHLQGTYEAIVKQWEKETDFETEEVEYLALYSRDVNNYLAIKKPEKEGDKIEVKGKGALANPWANQKVIEPWLHKNPANQICIDAVVELLTRGVPIESTIKNCKDITKFITVRTVAGGGVKLHEVDKVVVSTEYLGKAIRWYYSINERGNGIVYAKSGNLVAKSEGAMPCMTLPDSLPDDIDYEWYIAETESILTSIGYM
jgi:hypothetical protein